MSDTKKKIYIGAIAVLAILAGLSVTGVINLFPA